MAKRTFRDMVTARSVIASAPVDEEEFTNILGAVNTRLGLDLVASKEAYELFRDRIRVVAGRFWDEHEAIDRKTVLERLQKLTGHAQSIKAQLCPLREGLHETADTEVVSLLIQAVSLAHAGRHPRPREQLEISLKVIEGLEDTCARALVLLSELPAKRGQPSVGWYDELVSLMVHIAQLSGIKVSTGGDRSEDPYANPLHTSRVRGRARPSGGGLVTNPCRLRSADRPQPQTAEPVHTTEFEQNPMNSVV